VPFGKLFPKIILNFFESKILGNGGIGITAPTATTEKEKLALGAAAVKEKSKFCLFVRREIDDYRQEAYEFRIYARITRRSGNEEAWESLNNMARACCMNLSRARKTLQLLDLAEITQ